MWPARIWIQGDFSASLQIFLAWTTWLFLRSPLSLLLDQPLLSLLFLEEVVASDLHTGRELWCADVVHLLVMNQNLWRESLQDPDVLKGLVWGEPRFWIPVEALGNKVVEIWVFVANHVV